MISQLRKSDADDAWRWFIDRYRPFARSVLQKILSMRGRSRDLDPAADEFWAYLYSSNVFQRADRDRTFRNFLAGTLRNFARDYCRKNALVPTNDNFVPEAPVADDALLEDEELKLFARQVLRLALKHLEASHADSAKSMRWFYGVGDNADNLFESSDPMSVAEIAERLAVKPNAVHQHLYRGRKRLRARIEAEVRETVSNDELWQQELEVIIGALRVDAPGLTAE